VLQPLRSFGKPVADLFAPITYVQMQSLFDPFLPPGSPDLREVQLRAQLERRGDRNVCELRRAKPFSS
jgi:hypothetical protein